jgi:hypothetical protein
LNGTIAIPKFMKIYKVVHKLVVGDTQTDRQFGDLIKPTFIFLESRLIKTSKLPVKKGGKNLY